MHTRPAQAWLGTAFTKAMSYGHLQEQISTQGSQLVAKTKEDVMATKEIIPHHDIEQNMMASPHPKSNQTTQHNAQSQIPLAPNADYPENDTSAK
jgi:hypothetical protein